MKRLTKLGKGIVFALVLLIISGGLYAGYATGIIKLSKGESKEPETITSLARPASKSGKQSMPIEDVAITAIPDNVITSINLSLDEWIGWKPIIDANMGLTTKPESIFGKLGINVNIKIINDAVQSSNALINGNLDAAGYTVNRMAFLSSKFKSADFEFVMPFITNYSNGGDGIIVSSKYNSIEDLIDAKIAVPRFSEAQTLVIWFVQNSDLTNEQKSAIMSNVVEFGTPDEAAKAFFSGQVDAAATWQPYLTQAKNSTDSHVLFDTTSSSRLIMDGIVFGKKFANENTEIISKFIDGVFQAESMYDIEFKYIKEVMPMFADMTDQEIVEMTVDAGLANWSSNIETYNGVIQATYVDMCEVWNSIGETTYSDNVGNIFSTSYLESLDVKYNSIDVTSSLPEENPVVVTDSNKQSIIDTEALLTKTATINFLPDTAKFVDNAESSAILDNFIKIAKTLDGTIIQIEGNIASDNMTEGGQKLSEERAKTVSAYFKMNGVDPDRIIVIGNGNTNPKGDNSSEDGKKLNRRTDVFFKRIEQ